ncbi:MAG: stage 0 sporulation family protein [Deltaproteobacteria bacterium]|nr:stage 0 sporulation family protein [Deltaproteobacteria bacterium]MBW2595097.1 stage 0 sporulation family protein [Deltaproteobacteria bacterium]MBW2649457.1 stage 0 sporulation family protein [Deltaproteobacteria bacterium]
MKNIAGIRFKDKGKVYSFDATGVVLKEGDMAIVDTESGSAMGVVVNGIRVLPHDKLPHNLRKVVRRATDEDLKVHEENLKTEEEALEFCMERVRERNLSMRLVDVEALFDKNKLVFYFTAENRVDFRELVKDLVQKYKIKIELRQIWVRSEARICGGMGMCGRELCCSSFLNNFAPVSIKMAKEQNMLLNPEKISGLCGRLMCCLAFEHENYARAKKNMPKCGRSVITPEGKGKVVRQNILEEMVVVDLGDGKEVEISVHELPRKDRDRKPAT